MCKNKKNIIIDGQDSHIFTRYDSSKEVDPQADAFLIEDCTNVVLKNFTVDAENETNMTVILEEADEKDKYVIMRADDFYKVSGNEVFMTMCSVDSNGVFDHKFHLYHMHPDNANMISYIQNEIVMLLSYSGAKKEYLGDNRFKVYMPDFFTTWSKENVGKRICVRHSMYGPSVITVKNSDDTYIQNITMHRTPGMGIVVIGRCNNMTVDGLVIEKYDGSPTLMACNCDGIHIAGLTGTFTLKNSRFDGMGDDALNIHSLAGTVTRIVDVNTIVCNYCKRTPDGLLSKNWCGNGDIIRAFDPDSMEETAQLKVVSFDKDVLNFTRISGSVNEGDILQNTEFAQNCIVDNVKIAHSLGRGCVLQAQKSEVKNSKFSYMPNSGFIVAPAMKYWYEEGPTEELYVHDNEFEQCGLYANKASINVSTQHGDPDPQIKHLHKNIRIENNTFKTNNDMVISVAASDNVKIQNNTYIPNVGKKERERVKLIF